MFKKRLFVLIAVFHSISIPLVHAQIDRLRTQLNQSPDSLKASVLVDMARTFTSTPDSCIFYAQKAVEMAQKTNRDGPLIDAEVLLSRMMMEKKEYIRATNHRKNALNAALRIRDWNAAARNYYELARIWLLRYNYAEAIDNLKKGLEITRERDNPELLRDYYQALIEAYQKLYNVNAVCEYYPLLMEVDRQIEARAYNERIAAMEKEYHARISGLENRSVEENESVNISPFIGIIIIWAILTTLLLAAAIIFYRYRITVIITKDQKLLEDTVKEIEDLKAKQGTLFQFLTQYAYTSIDNLRENIDHFADEQEESALPAVNNTLYQINNEIFALYGFFQNFLLLLQAQSGQLKPEQITVNIPQLATNLLADYEAYAVANDIQLVNDVQNNVFALADERLIDIVLRNLMSNAFKYASGGGMISLGAKENYTDMEVWVTDDGIGLTAEQSSKLFILVENLSLPGKLDIKGFGLGLAVCKALVETCKGRIWAETRPGEGFCIRFSLPKSEGREMKVQS